MPIVVKTAWNSILFLAANGQILMELLFLYLYSFWGVLIFRPEKSCFETVSRCFLQVGNQIAKIDPVVSKEKKKYLDIQSSQSAKWNVHIETCYGVGQDCVEYFHTWQYGNLVPCLTGTSVHLRFLHISLVFPKNITVCMKLSAVLRVWGSPNSSLQARSGPLWGSI